MGDFGGLGPGAMPRIAPGMTMMKGLALAAAADIAGAAGGLGRFVFLGFALLFGGALLSFGHG